MAISANPKKPAHTEHTKKRYGLHQKHTKRFKDAYWPYLPLLLIVGLGLIFSNYWSNSKGVLGYATDMSINQLLNDTNQDRSSHNLQNLTLDKQLMKAAQTKADDMASRNYWSHNTPYGETPWQFMTNAGYDYQLAGENLAYGFTSASATNTAWMNSPEHRANILKSGYTQIGFGIANSQNYQGTGPQTIVVQMFGKPVASTTLASQHYQAKPLDSSNSELAGTTAPLAAPEGVSRIQILAPGASSWSLMVVSLIACLATLWFILRHGFMWRRAFVYGENFVVHHRLLDLLIVTIAVAGFILTRSAGIIS